MFKYSPVHGAWQRFSVIQSLFPCYEVHLDSTENINKDLYVPHLLIMSAKMRYCIVQEWMVCYLKLFFLYFTDICSLYSLWGRKSFHLATVKLCTSCSQTADRKAWSLKSEMKFHFYWGGKKSIFNWFEWTLPPHATHCLASCLRSADAHWSA